MPGRSTRVKSTTFGEKIVKEIGSSEMFLSLPHVLAVYSSISLLILLKSKYFSSFLCKNSPYSVSSDYFTYMPPFFSSNLLSYKTKGHLVTMPEPLGKKSLPTIDSRTDDFPVD